ncbi:hypothetical protein BH23ACT9_BH23ACT9_22660 [soil metagenome]
MWTVDGTLIPTRDRKVAGKSKNYRYSTNAQILSRRSALLVIAVDGGGPGNRNDTIHYRGSTVEQAAKPMVGCWLTVATGASPSCTPVFAGNRIVRDHVWRRHRKRRARAEHCIARLKDWQILRDHRRQGPHLLDSLRAVAYLHNMRILAAALGVRGVSYAVRRR